MESTDGPWARGGTDAIEFIRTERRLGSIPFSAKCRVLAATTLSCLGSAACAGPVADEWVHRVERGDTLIGLHARLLRPQASWRELQRLNRIADPRRLVPGSALRIPLAMLREEPVTVEVLHTHGEVWVERGGTPRAPLSAGTTLAAGDVLHTGAQSSLSLRFADGSRALLGPGGRLAVERLMRLGASGVADTRLRLESGSIEAQVPPASAPARPAPRFELRTPAVNLGVRGTAFRGRADAQRTVAEVTSGRVAVGPQALDAGFGVTADQRGVGPVRALLAAPDLAGMPQRVERLPLRLPLPEVSGSATQRVQIFDLATPQRLLLEGLFAPPTAAWPDNLPDGRYEVRVRASDTDGVEGHEAIAQITLKARPEPPFLLRPRAGEAVVDEEVELAWSRNPQAARYRLQVSRTPTFEAPLALERDDLTANELRVRLPPATYHWRVMSVRPDGDSGPWGDALVMERLERPPPPPPPPAPGAPASQGPQAVEEGVMLSWSASPLPGARYQVQVARDPAFAAPVLDQTTTQTQMLLARPDAGTYHVRVRTIAADGRASDFGSAQVVEVPRSFNWLWLVPLPLLLLLL